MSWIVGLCPFCKQKPRSKADRYGLPTSARDDWKGWRPGTPAPDMCPKHRMISQHAIRMRLATWAGARGGQLAEHNIDAIRVIRACVAIGKGPHLNAGQVLALDRAAIDALVAAEPVATRDKELSALDHAILACRIVRPGKRNQWQLRTPERQPGKEPRKQRSYYATDAEMASARRRTETTAGANPVNALVHCSDAVLVHKADLVRWRSSVQDSDAYLLDRLISLCTEAQGKI